MAGRKRRVGPLQDGYSRSACHRLAGCRSQSSAQVGDKGRRLVVTVTGVTDLLNAGQDLVEGVRIGGHHLRRAAEVLQRVPDFADVDGAHRTQVLGDHQGGVEPG